MQLNDVPTLLADQQFPTTATQLSETLGDEEIHHPDGTETLADVFERCGPETFDCSEDAVAAVYAGVSAEAVGRVGYSDRDPAPIGTYGPEQISF
jgi:hypothetical protein